MQAMKDHSLFIKKVTCYEEGSCNNCNGYINPSGEFAPDAWVWIIHLRTSSFRLCAGCMKELKKQIKETIK